MIFLQMLNCSLDCEYSLQYSILSSLIQRENIRYSVPSFMILFSRQTTYTQFCNINSFGRAIIIIYQITLITNNLFIQTFQTMDGQSQDNNINIKIIDKNQEQTQSHNPYSKVKIHTRSFFPDSDYVDDTFKLNTEKNTKKIIKRLKDIFPVESPIFPQDCQQYYTKKLSMPRPTYLSQIKMLPVSYYKQLISPKYINKQGYYQVIVWKDGRMIKDSIDDFFQFHEEKNCPIIDMEFKAQPWLLLLLKAWAKVKGGYNKIYEAESFEFIRTFSFPIWDVINPCVQNKQSREQLLKKLSRVRNKNQLFIAKTKPKPQVGYYGLYPGSASYQITGFYQDYQKVFIKLRAYVYGQWNGQSLTEESKEKDHEKLLQQNEFIMPLNQFLNVFNLVFFTLDFYSDSKKKVYYNRYNLSVDAREAKAKIVTFNVQKECQVGINTYFPPSRTLDLQNPHPSKIFIKQEQQMRIIVPYCKILVGKLQQNANLDASFVDSVRENLLNDKNGDFLSMKSHIQYQFIHCDFFKGYMNQITFFLKLKPGRYYIRYKLQKIISQYRISFNTVATEEILITDAKMAKPQMNQFLNQALSSKARNSQRNITFINPLKKGSWIIMNPDFETVGYGYAVIQALKNSEFKIIVQIDTGILKANGYCLKGKKNVTDRFNLTAEDGSSIVLIIKKIPNYQKEHIWPPPGINFRKLKR